MHTHAHAHAYTHAHLGYSRERPIELFIERLPESARRVARRDVTTRVDDVINSGEQRPDVGEERGEGRLHLGPQRHLPGAEWVEQLPRRKRYVSTSALCAASLADLASTTLGHTGSKFLTDASPNALNSCISMEDSH